MNDHAQKWDAGLYDHKHAFVWKYGEALVELLAPQPGERILDLGCGTGHLTARIADSGAVVTGLDSSAGMLDTARATYPHITFVEANARDFSFETPFDAIFSNAALHWITPPEAVIRCMSNSLRPQGRLVVEFGGRGNVAQIAKALREATAKTGIPFLTSLRYYPSVGEYATLLEAAGLEVRDARLYDRPTPLEGEHGLRDWVRMFCREALDAVAEDKHEEYLAAAEDAARPVLYREGWFADYRRLRIIAVKG